MNAPPIATSGRAVNDAVAWLASRDRWVIWRAERRNGKLAKVPYVAGGRRRASSTNPRTWNDFDTCWRSAFVDGAATGIGIVLVDDDPDHLMAADLDQCIADDGTVKPWAQEAVDLLNSYTEISPSGTGLRVFFLDTMPDKGRKVRFRGGHLELYRSERYLTVTGAHLTGAPEEINAVEPRVIAKLLGPRATSANGEDRGEDLGDVGEVPDELRDRLEAAMADDPPLWAAYNGEAPAGPDQTGSAFDFKLAGALRRHGGFSLQDFATIARWWPYGKGAAGDARHWRRSWERAKPTGSGQAKAIEPVMMTVADLLDLEFAPVK